MDNFAGFTKNQINHLETRIPELMSKTGEYQDFPGSGFQVDSIEENTFEENDSYLVRYSFEDDNNKLLKHRQNMIILKNGEDLVSDIKFLT